MCSFSIATLISFVVIVLLGIGIGSWAIIMAHRLTPSDITD